MTTEPSIFRQLYTDEAFTDRYLAQPEAAVEVIIPVIHTNELWRRNLLSFYREIPIRRLLIGDGGCIDDSLTIAQSFPRVAVYDHRSFTSLGYSLRHLIAAVETEWFIYLHSDVYLPQGWFDTMRQHQGAYDWYESRQQSVIFADYPVTYGDDLRPLSGGQMGRRAAFEQVLPQIDDDYLYRNEDIILASLVQRAGFRYGWVQEATLYHQTMAKASQWQRRIKGVQVQLEIAPDEQQRATLTFIRGLIKYMLPDPHLARAILFNLDEAVQQGYLAEADFYAWVQAHNADWLPHLRAAMQANARQLPHLALHRPATQPGRLAWARRWLRRALGRG